MTSVHEQFEALRVSLANCHLVVFVDLVAELALSHSAARKPPQEELDALAAATALVLPVSKDSPDETLLLSPERALFFLRSPERTEALCCVCDLAQDIREMRSGAQTVLRGISASN